MSWSDPAWTRRAALGGCAGALAACGFAPAYGPGGGGARFRDAVLADAPDDDLGYAFVSRIEDRLGRPDAPLYALAYAIDVATVGRAIDQSDNVTRYDVDGRLDWTLTEGDRTVLAGQERAFTGYSTGNAVLSAVESERAAGRRLMVMLADRVVARILAAG